MMFNKRVHYWGLVLLGGLLANAAAVNAASPDSGFEQVPPGEEMIKVRPSEPAAGPVPSGAFQAKLRTESSQYRVGERIRFRVRGNQPFFLYLLNVDPATGRAVTILPNRYQGKDRIKYPAGQWNLVPNPQLEFYSDRPGVERIIMVASTRYLDVQRLLNRGRSRAIGDFYEMESFSDGMDAVLTELHQSDGGDEAIRVRQTGSRLPRGIVIDEVNLRIY